MPKELYSGKGIHIVQNERNGFVVCTLHYTADPRKRSEYWKQETRKGLSQAQWDQEYEISYDAKLGEKVFPEIRDRRNEIVIADGPFIDNAWPTDIPMWMGFDYGARNPSSVHVYTIWDGVIYAIWELYEPCKNIRAFVDKLKSCPYWHQVRYIAFDPSMDNLSQRNAQGNMTSVRAQFEELGILKFLKGNSDEQAWLAAMQRHWQGETVTFKIMLTCPKMIEEFEDATYVSMTDRQLETQNYKEALVDKKNHAMDDCKYFINTRPSTTPRKLKSPNLIQMFSPWRKDNVDAFKEFRMGA